MLGQYAGYDVGMLRPRSRIRSRMKSVAGALAAVLAGAAVFLPVPYVIESPGPTFNTVGEVQSKPLIEIQGRPSFPTSGQLDLTTVYVQGGPNGDISVFDAFRAWLHPQESVLPVELVYPPGITQTDVQEQNAVAMTSSQESAVAAALAHEGISFKQWLSVAGFSDGSPSAGRLKVDDIITRIDRTPVTDIDVLRNALNRAAGDSVRITVQRNGATVTETITPRKSAEGTYQLGVMLATNFDFPFNVRIALDNVGGPSAGMMFALGIVDKLTPGALTGGRHVAGTGTIDATGAVGPIGGIAQKMVGAQNAGAAYFLAPAENCDDVVGNIPEGLQVVKVETLDQAVDAVRTFAAGKDSSRLPTCSAE